MKHRAFALTAFAFLPSALLALLFASCGAGIPSRWDNPRVLDISGRLSSHNDKKAAIFLGKDGSLLAEGILSDGETDIPVLVCLDTGSQGSYVDLNLLSTLGKAAHSRYCFPGSIDGGKPSVGIGYVFSSLSLGDIRIDKPLLSSVDLGRTPRRADGGRKATVILGMNFLTRSPFLLSMTDRTLSFPETPPAWPEPGLVNEKEEHFTDLRLRLPLALDGGGSTVFRLATGTGLSTCDGETATALKPQSPSRLRLFNEPPYRFTFINKERLDFAGRENQDAIFWSAAPRGMPNALGMQILCAYDLYADYRGQSLMIRPAEEVDPAALRHLLEKPGASRLSPTFGFSIKEKGYRRFVHGLFSAADGSQLVPELKRGDELVSIDGVGLKGYDWTRWYKLDEAEFAFQREGTEFTLRLKRRKLGE